MPPVPQVLSTRILAMKASLCKLSPCTVTRVCDYHAKLFLIAVSSMLKSLLRPHILNTPDKSPGDRLTEICTKITDVGGSCLYSSTVHWCLLCQAWFLKERNVPALRADLELGADFNQRGTKDKKDKSAGPGSCVPEQMPGRGGAVGAAAQVGLRAVGSSCGRRWTACGSGPSPFLKVTRSAILSTHSLTALGWPQLMVGAGGW